MKSAVYVGKVHHARTAVKKYRFSNSIAWWLLDLDEIDQLQQKFLGFRRGNFSLFAFRDQDHINLGHETAKENILAWLREQGVQETIQSVQLLTNLRNLGYVFNPVSFYFIQGETHRWIVAEVGNTFWEQKPTLLGPFTGNDHEQIMDKLFYVSPFLNLDNRMKLRLTWPNQELRIVIEDFSSSGEKELTASFAGHREELTQGLILKLSLVYPLASLGIISAIHWHALKLWLMKVPYIKKNENPHLQQGVFVWKSRKFVKP